MASYAFIEKTGGNEVKRLGATEASVIRLVNGKIKDPATVVVGDVLKVPGNTTVRVDQIDVA